MNNLNNLIASLNKKANTFNNDYENYKPQFGQSQEWYAEQANKYWDLAEKLESLTQDELDILKQSL